jgi:hypothetical protein
METCQGDSKGQAPPAAVPAARLGSPAAPGHAAGVAGPTTASPRAQAHFGQNTLELAAQLGHLEEALLFQAALLAPLPAPEFLWHGMHT